MGETIYEFAFEGPIDTLIQKVNDWQTTTTEGKRYRKKTPPLNSFLKLQRGVGFLTAPIIFEFYLRKEAENSLDISIVGYVKSFLLFKSSLTADAKAGGLPRRNGWKDMEKLLSFIGITKYQHSFR